MQVKRARRLCDAALFTNAPAFAWFADSPIVALTHGDSMTLAFTFPGQGSQEIGMGRALMDAFPSAKAVFQEVDEALGQDLTKIILEGPLDLLTLTENAQPALMAVSLAVVRALKAEFGVSVDKAAFVAGHSLGEYSALAAAGALSLAETAKLLKLRGQAMQRAVPVGKGAMASLIGPKVDMALAEAAAAAGSKAGICVVANDNNVGNIVISGSKAGVDAGIAAAKELGGKAIVLNVSAPFHSPLMAPAAEEMRAALATAKISTPVVPVIANVTAGPVTDPEAIRKLLAEQVTGRVRWRESMLWMAKTGKVTRIAELGAGKVLSGMAKRLVPDAESLSVNDPDSLAAFAASL
jgi:[acyl-carrier-protein] S-malonyltransferase